MDSKESSEISDSSLLYVSILPKGGAKKWKKTEILTKSKYNGSIHVWGKAET